MDHPPPPASSNLAEPINALEDVLAGWASLAARSPPDPVPLLAPIQALIAAGRLTEAGVLLDAAQFRFPDHAPFAVEAARVAQRQGATDEALRRWQTVRDRFPRSAAGVAGAAAALRQAGRPAEAEALLAAAVPQFPHDPGLAIDHAWLAHARRDWPEALHRWSKVRERFPDQPQGYSGAAATHRVAGEFDLADALLQYAMQRFPNAAGLAFDYGWVAQARRDWPEALRRWEAARVRAPDVPAGYTAAAAALRELGRLDEADTLLRDAAGRFSDDLAVVVEQAWLAEARRDWAAAECYWDRVRPGLPGEEVVYTGGARAAREQGRAEKADALLREAIARFPGRRSPLTEHAWLAQISRDWPAAVERWAVVRARFSDHAEAYSLAARALLELGRDDEADAVLTAGVARLPSLAEIAADHADLAMRRQDWLEAAQRWEAAVARFPAETRFADRLREARQRIAESALPPDLNLAARAPAPKSGSAPESGPAPKPALTAVDRQVRDLMLQFESLGGQQLGCEFGIVQRDCGAEPLGLLRWADMPYDGILAVLESRCAGVGTEANTELFVTAMDGGPREYCTRDRRGFMLMRTFIPEDEVPSDRMYAASCRRLQFLARKLVEDLEAGTKIFVYRLTDRELTGIELERLRAAMRSYGDSTLLYVRRADAQHPDGTVELAGPGLLVGSMDRFKVSPTGEVLAPAPTASWLTLCRNAWDLWRALRS
jgi:tetratricopeptide (TPR) repeat protein